MFLNLLAIIIFIGIVVFLLSSALDISMKDVKRAYKLSPHQNYLNLVQEIKEFHYNNPDKYPDHFAKFYVIAFKTIVNTDDRTSINKSYEDLVVLYQNILPSLKKKKRDELLEKLGV